MTIDRSFFNADVFEKSDGAEVLHPSQVSTNSQTNYDNFADKLAVAEVITETLIKDRRAQDVFSTSTDAEAIIARQTIYHALDTFQVLASIEEESLESSTIEWLLTAVTLTEVTDAIKDLPVIINQIVADDNIKVDFEVLPTSTATNVEEYLITGNGAGTIDFNGTREYTDGVKTIQISALTQALAKPARTVNIRLKNPVGTGSYWPKIVVNAPITSGYMNIFNRYLYHNSDFITGSTKEDQALKIANAWNSQPNYSWLIGYQMINEVNTPVYSKATAVAIGNVVEFQIDTTMATIPSTDYMPFNGTFNNTSLRGNISGSNYVYLPPSIGRAGQPWTVTVGPKNTLVVTIAAHGARPGIVSMLSYDATSRRMTKRGQVPTSSVSGLKEQLDSILARLKNKGF